MITVVSRVWPLLLGILLIMLDNGYLSVVPTDSPVAVEAADVWAAEHAEAERESSDEPEEKG